MKSWLSPEEFGIPVWRCRRGMGSLFDASMRHIRRYGVLSFNGTNDHYLGGAL